MTTAPPASRSLPLCQTEGEDAAGLFSARLEIPVADARRIVALHPNRTLPQWRNTIDRFLAWHHREQVIRDPIAFAYAFVRGDELPEERRTAAPFPMAAGGRPAPSRAPHTAADRRQTRAAVRVSQPPAAEDGPIAEREGTDAWAARLTPSIVTPSGIRINLPALSHSDQQLIEMGIRPPGMHDEEYRARRLAWTHQRGREIDRVEAREGGLVS